MGAPLLIHLMFHPASAQARALATKLHAALNNDPALPGLRVPTVLLAEDGTNLPAQGSRFERGREKRRRVAGG